jgi:hypothetical protein
LPELSHTTPTLTAVDLYAARCGILHTLTSKSDLSTKGRAKQIAYAWGDAEASALDALLETTQFAGKIVTLHYETLFNGLVQAIARFMDSAQGDLVLVSRLEDAANLHYTIVPNKACPGGLV